MISERAGFFGVEVFWDRIIEYNNKDNFFLWERLMSTNFVGSASGLFWYTDKMLFYFLPMSNVTFELIMHKCFLYGNFSIHNYGKWEDNWDMLVNLNKNISNCQKLKRTLPGWCLMTVNNLLH